MNNQDKEAFERWWNEEGSGMPPIGDEDHEEHMHRVAEIAWMNGAYAARGQWPTATIPTSGDDDRFFHAWLCELAKGEWGVTEAELREWFGGWSQMTFNGATCRMSGERPLAKNNGKRDRL